MSDPLNDFLSEFGPKEKTALAPSPWGHASKGALGALGGAAVSAALGGAAMAASHIYDAATKSRDFRNMLSYNQDLVEHHERDPRMFNQMFTSLRDMNPTFSKDPLVAGTYMRRMVEGQHGGSTGGILAESAGSRDAFPTHMSRALEHGMSGAGRAFGAAFVKDRPEDDPLYGLRQQVTRHELEQKHRQQQEEQKQLKMFP